MVASSADACALWRLYMPHIALPGSAFHFFPEKPDWDKIAEYDAVVVQRLCTVEHFQFIATCRALGMKVIYDLDDNVWEIPDYNPARAVLHRLREGFINCIRMVDIVSVSTKELEKAVRKHVGKRLMIHAQTGREIPIVVAGNRIEKRLFSEPARVARMIVGWAGSSSHIGDLGLVESAVMACSQEFENVEFQFRGCVLAEDSKIRNARGYKHVLWTPVAEYAARMPQWGWKIALAPVTDVPFNDAKSAIKLVEAGYCGIPCLASWVRPYEEFCSRDRELMWLLCATPGQFEKKLRELLGDVARREDLGARMRIVADKHYSFDREHEGWEEILSLVQAA